MKIRIDKFASNWAIKKLGDISVLQGGSQPPKSTFKYEQTEGYVRLLQIRDFSRDDKKVYVPVSTKNRTCTAKDILIGRYGASVGKICTGLSGAYNVALIKATPKSDLIDKRYYLHYLNSTLFQAPLAKVSSRSAQDGFSKNDIRDFVFPLPPLPTQRAIVARLDAAFARIDRARANLERNVANARELFQAKLNEVFSRRGDGWEEKDLGDLCKFQNGFAFKSKLFRPQGTPVIRITNISNDKINLDKAVFTDPKDYSRDLSKYRVVPGDLLIAMSGATTGKIGIHKLDTECLLNQRVGLFKPRKELDKNYLFFYLKNKAEENLNISAGAAQPNLSTKQIKEFKIPIHSVSSQKKIVDQLEDLNNNLENYVKLLDEKLSFLDSLKQSLLQKAFRGKLIAEAEAESASAAH